MTEKQTSWKSKPSDSKKFAQTAMMASSRSKGTIDVPESILQKNEERKKQLVADKIQIFESTTNTSPPPRRFSDAKLSTSPANISQMINKFQQSPSPPLDDQKRSSFSHFKTNSSTKITNNNQNNSNNSNNLSNSASKISTTSHQRSSTVSSPSNNRISTNSSTNSSSTLSDSNNSLNNSNSSLSNSLNNSGNKSNSSSPSNSLKVDKNETIIRNIIIQLEKDFPWFSKGWEDEIESKREEEIKTLISIITNFTAPPNEKTPTDAHTEKMNAISPYLHMSVKEKWAKADSNLTVSMDKDRLTKISSLVQPFQEQITEFISSAYKSVNIQVNFDGSIVGTENATIDASKIILLITQKIELLTEEGNSSVKLINDLRKVILDKISSTSFIGIAKEHILSAANLSYNPKYVNNLVLVRLNTLLDRLRSLTVQIVNAISALDIETGLVDHRSILENLSCFRLITGNIKKVVDQLATSQALSELLRKKMSDFDENKKKKKSYKRKKAGTSHTNPDNIYNFNKDQPKNENWEDGAGTLNSLVLRLTSTEQIDQMYMKSFITTYLSFTTSENLLNKIMERYHVPSTISQEEKIQIQLRVCIVIKYWIDTKMKDFEDDLILKLVDFIDFQLKNDGHIDAAKMLRSTLDKSISKVNEETVVNHPKIEIFEVRWSPTDMLLNASEKDIAEQITLISWRNYKNIDVNELLNLAWAKKQTRHRSPNIIACIKRFNHVSFWVATMILFHEKLKDRSKVITKFIGIAQELRKLNNYDGIMYIIAGLRSSAIDRLQFSKFSVNESLLTAFDEIANIMSPKASWKMYREVLRSSALPAIPFIGIYLTDLTFIEDGNPDLYRDRELINFNKRQMVYKVLQEIIVFQSVSYQIEPKEPILSYLTQMPFLKEEELYNLSIQREPRGCTIKDLL